MKKTIITTIKLLVIIVFFASCKSSSYLLTNNDYSTGVDFTTGKWLLNNLDFPANKMKNLLIQPPHFLSNN